MVATKMQGNPKKAHPKQQKATTAEKPSPIESPQGKPPHTVQTKGFFSPL